MNTNLWSRATTALRERYRTSATAQYGAGLGCDCGDCPSGPTDVDIPSPRRRQAMETRETRETVGR